MRFLSILSFVLFLTGCPLDKSNKPDSTETSASSSDCQEDSCKEEKSKTTSKIADKKEKVDSSSETETSTVAEEEEKEEDPVASDTVTTTATATAVATTTSVSVVKYAVMTLDTDSHSFGNGVLNAESDHTVTISNVGDASASSVAVSSLSVPYRVITNTCSSTLLANESCAVKVGYNPSSIGTHNATLTITYYDGSEIKTKNFSLSGITEPIISSISPSSSVATQVLTLNGYNFTNQTSVKVGANSCNKISVNANQITCTIPSGSSTQVVSASESQKESLYSSFTYLAPASLSITSSYSFGTIRKSNTSSASLTLTNTGGFAASNIAYSVSSPFSASGCSSLNPGSSCSVSLGYAPTSVGSLTESLSITYNNGSAATSTSSSLSGTAIPKVVQVAAGNVSSCLLYSEGNIKCVGLNRRLGNGTNDNIYITSWANATEVYGINNATQISLHDSASCARLSNSTVKCWGQFKMPNDATYYTTPEVIPGITNAISVNVGNSNISIKTADGSIKTWGLGTQGQLGGSSLNSSSTPVTLTNVPSSYEISSYATGFNHQMAVTSTGEVVTWGFELFSLRNGCNVTNTSATPVVGLSNIAQVTAGQEFSCALNTSGTVYCWGRNTWGQIGIGITTPALINLPASPTQVIGISNATSIVSNYANSCAIKNDKRLYCWGYNTFGSVGVNSISDYITSANLVSDVSNVASVSVGYLHTMALTESGDVYVWGMNDSYQLGLNDITNRRSAVNINIE